MNIAAADRWCRRFVARHHENFRVVSLFLPRREQRAYAALYSFARIADDLADDDADPEHRLESLSRLQGQLDALYAGNRPDHPVFIALEPVIVRYSLEKELFIRLLDAFRLDQVKNRYSTWREVLEYTAGSADPVGRIVLRVHGYRDEELDLLSDRICTGLQLVNFIQDIGEDLLRRDRIYLPQEDLERFGVDRRMLLRSPSPSEVCRLVAFEVARAEQLLAGGRRLISLVDNRLARQLILFHGGGRLALHRIRRKGYNIASIGTGRNRVAEFALLQRAFRGKPL